MRASDIKVGYVYNVIFNPVRDCEFDGRHLAVVLKKNNDGATFIVMPLTTASNGAGINKVCVGKISTLPTSLKSNDTYAVFNQVRTVNANRFISLKEGGMVVDALFPQDKFQQILELAIQELVYSVSQDNKVHILKMVYEHACVEQAKDIAYNIIALEKSPDDVSTVVSELENKIRDILPNISYTLDQKYIDDGIDVIFKRSLGL